MEAETHAARVPQSLEAGISSAMNHALGSLHDQYLACEKSVRKSPGSSLLVAGIAGYVFRNLPLGAFLGGLIRLALALVRPALVLYVAAKGYELMSRGGVPATTGEKRRNGIEARRPQRTQRG